MTEQTTPLRQRMIEDMTIRNMSPSTQKIYVRAVANFSIFHGRSPVVVAAERSEMGSIVSSMLS
jgi:integrase/recombinase XerD